MESLDKSIDVKIIRTLKESPPITLQEISNKLNISKMTVYKHVSRLESMGFIKKRIIRSNVGRPKHSFLLTTKGKDLLHYPYDELFKSLITFLVHNGHRALVVDFIRMFLDEKAVEYNSRMPEGDLDVRLNQLLKILSKEGYMPVMSTKDNSYEIEINNCPLRTLCDVCSEFCEIEVEMFQAVVGKHIEMSHISNKDEQKCKFLISQASKR